MDRATSQTKIATATARDLPTKLSELILLAVGACKECEADPANFELQMSEVFYRTPAGKVAVDMFGAILVKRLGLGVFLDRRLRNLTIEISKFEAAIDALRVGRLYAALDVLAAMSGDCGDDGERKLSYLQNIAVQRAVDEIQLELDLNQNRGRSTWARYERAAKILGASGL